MKTNLILKKCLIVCSSLAFMSIMLPAISMAQPTIIPAALPDNPVTTSGNFGYPNASTIDYTPFNAGLGPVDPQLTAVVTGAALNTASVPIPQVWVNDQVAGWVSQPIPGANSTSFTDVVVGNDVTTPGQYIVAVVFTNLSDVWLATYSVTGTGSGSLSFGLLVPPTNISNSLNVVGPVHIDIIAQSSNPYPGIGGLPRARQFVVTWEETAMGIWAYSANIDNPTASSPVQINPNDLAHLPDVAGVERQKPSGAFESWALFTYAQQISAIDRVDFYVTYQQWNITDGNIWPLEVYDIKPLVNTEELRIDAIDNFNDNNPGPDIYPTAPPATNAVFCIAVTSNTSPKASDILVYNNIAGKWKNTNISAPPGLGGEMNLSPAIACGPGQNYTVAYNSRTFSSTYAPYFATSVSWATGVANLPANAYAVPVNPYTSSGIPDDGIAIAATINRDALGFQEVFPAWQNAKQIWGKYTNTVAYLFKQALAVPGVTATDYDIMPNPASDYVIVTGPGNNFDHCTYQITDMAGRTLQQAPLTSTKEMVNISDLADGMYVLNILSNDVRVNTFKLVKQ